MVLYPGQLGLLGSALAFQPRRHRHLYISLCHCPPPTISLLLSCIHLRTPTTPPTTCTIPSSSPTLLPLLPHFPSDTSSPHLCARLSRLNVISNSQELRQRQAKRLNHTATEESFAPRTSTLGVWSFASWDIPFSPGKCVLHWP